MMPALADAPGGRDNRGMSYELAFIGAGNMAEAIARGVLRAGVLKADQMVAADIAPARRELFSKQLAISAVEDPAQAARGAKIILLAVKPQQMKTALAAMGPALASDVLIISIAAGISCSFIEKNLPAGNWRIIRTMPNTPMLVGEGMVAMAAGRHAAAGDMAAARRIFESAATVIEVTEDQLDAVTAVSGSGPAYFFFLIEQMIAAGVELGLTPEQAHTLATRTAAGAAKMLATSTDSPGELRRKVTSPGGTTQAAIETMQQRQVPESIVAAIRRAAERSKELGS